ncbi:hypothetical protein DAMA08_005750 [Martiniozyma asiatica (nom. inval.)]|nr:hypothetical protein DAMA08_005750 [Martiniozyma asiatica]
MWESASVLVQPKPRRVSTSVNVPVAVPSGNSLLSDPHKLRSQLTGIYLSYIYQLLVHTFTGTSKTLTTPLLTKLVYFITELTQRCKLDPNVWVLSLYYLTIISDPSNAKYKIRTSEQSKKLKETLCIRRLWLSCIIIASKYHNEKNYNLQVWAKWTGLPVSAIRENERFVLALLNYELYVDYDHLKKYAVDYRKRCIGIYQRKVAQAHYISPPTSPVNIKDSTSTPDTPATEKARLSPLHATKRGVDELNLEEKALVKRQKL